MSLLPWFFNVSRPVEIFPDKKYALLSTFFFVEIGSFEDRIRENIQEVVQGRAEKRNISGNICEMVIKKKDTAIYDMLAEDGRGAWCSVPTQELLSMIDEWHISGYVWIAENAPV